MDGYLLGLTTWGKRVRAAIAMLVGFSVAVFYVHILPVDVKGGAKEILIETGTGVRGIGTLLQQEKLIRSPRAFRVVSFLYGVAHVLKPGRYTLSSASSTREIVSALAKGPESDERVFVVEGATIAEIDAELSVRRLFEPGSLRSLSPSSFRARYPFLATANSLEGFFFPETYHVAYGIAAPDFATAFLDVFQKKAWPLLAPHKNWYDTLIIASLLEKEVMSIEDRRLVAGIITRRLELRMPLQIDATIVYAKCGAFKACPLARSDFTIVSPFNTYTHRDLPPTPIGNPSEDAIRAALTPRTSPYLYYLTDPKTKRTHYSTTLEEHNEKRAKYLGL